MVSPPLLDVKNLTVGFRSGRTTTTVVDGVSFTLEPGRCLALVGESGSGKSVTARSILGLAGGNEVTSADRLTVGTKNVLGLSPAKLRSLRGADVGLVLQDALVSLDPLRPVGREIADALRLHTRLSPAQRAGRVQELLSAVGIPQPELRARQRSDELSGGLRQRALIASAIALDPPLLIADEPTTALDTTMQEQILRLLEGLKRNGTAVLLISHDLAVVSRVADEIAVMTEGRIVEHGPTRRVLETPAAEYTRRLIRAVPSGRPRGTRLSVGPGLPHAEPLRGLQSSVPDARGAASTSVSTLVGEATPATAAARDASSFPGFARAGEPAPATAQARDGRPAPTLPPATVLEAAHLVKHYSGPGGTRRLVVDDVSLVLERGRTLGLVGESGSGKTTTARLVLGLIAPESGVVTLGGEPWSALRERQRRERRRRIGAIYQDALGSFDPRWSVRETLVDALTFGRSIRNREQHSQVHELLDAVGLPSSLADRRPLHLSGGQRQRVSIARALAPQPDIIVCDEPVSALDVSVQAQVLDLLDDLQRERGLSYLFISHDLGVVQHMSDAVAVMLDGRIVEQGPSAEVFAHPAEEYTRRLLEASPKLG